MGPDPRIRITGYQIQTLKFANKKQVFSLNEGYTTSVFKENKVLEIEVYLAAFDCFWNDPDTDPDPYKYIRFWILDA